MNKNLPASLPQTLVLEAATHSVTGNAGNSFWKTPTAKPLTSDHHSVLSCQRVSVLFDTANVGGKFGLCWWLPGFGAAN